MRRISWIDAWKIAATYIGTIVGAGFASGQEVLQFFTRNGSGAIAGVILSALLFFALGVWVMRIGRDRGAHSFGELAQMALGTRMGPFVQAVMLVMLLGVTVAMVAGSGALFSEQLGVPIVFGDLITLILSSVVLLFGLRGVMSANALIVPLMISFIVLTFFFNVIQGGFSPMQLALTNIPQPSTWQVIMSALTYAGFNVGLSLTVLVPLGNVPHHRQTLTVGAGLGALGLASMLILIHLMLVNLYHPAPQIEIPMGQVAALLPPLLRFGFVLTLWAEIFSTLVANVYGIAHELSANRPQRFAGYSAAILAVSFLASQIGFAPIVSYVYPVFGYIGLIILLILLLSQTRTVRL